MTDLAHPDFTFRGSLGSEVHGITAFCEYVKFITTALDEYRCDIETIVAEPTRVFAKVLFSGIHRGEFFGAPPSGCRVSWYGTALFTFVNGKIADLWVLGDVDGLKRQLATNPVQPDRVFHQDRPILSQIGAEIRLADSADALALAQLRYDFRSTRAVPSEPITEFLPRCTAWMTERLHGAGLWQCWVATTGKQIIGAIWVEHIEKIPNPVSEPELHAYITNFYIRTEARGQGIGGKLLTSAIEDCRVRHVHAVLLWPSERSRPLYMRHGFLPHGPIMYLDLAAHK